MLIGYLPEGAAHYDAFRSLIVMKPEALRAATHKAAVSVSHQIKITAFR